MRRQRAQLDRLDRQRGIAEMVQPHLERRIGAGLEAELGRHGEHGRGLAAGELGGGEVAPRRQRAAVVRQPRQPPPQPVAAPAAAAAHLDGDDRLRRVPRRAGGEPQRQAVGAAAEPQIGPAAIGQAAAAAERGEAAVAPAPPAAARA